MGKIKKVFKSIAKVVKKVVSSPLGKIALVAAGAYFAAPAILGATGAAGGAAASGAAAAGTTGATLGTAGATLGGTAATAAAGSAASGIAAGAGLTTTATAAATTASSGFFGSTAFKAASTAASLGSAASSLLAKPQIPTMNSPSDGDISAEAARNAELERDRKRRGAAANTLTSPLGITNQSRSAALLG